MSDDNDSKPTEAEPQPESTGATPPERNSMQRDHQREVAKRTEGRMPNPRSDN